jgi:hypothetical protein
VLTIALRHADDGNVAGSRRFHAKMGTLMVVHAAFATEP